MRNDWIQLFIRQFLEIHENDKGEGDSRPELVEEEGVRHDHAQEDHEQVQELAEAKVEVVASEPGPKIEEVLRNCPGVTVLREKKGGHWEHCVHE